MKKILSLLLGLLFAASAFAQPIPGTTVDAKQSGTWTVQPGNTANTTPWLASIAQGGNTATVSAGGALTVDASGSTQPVSGTVTCEQATAANLNATVVGTGTFATQSTATQSGTWTVQPGNTANTTPWLASISQGGNTATVTASSALKVDGSAVTQPVSGTVTADTELAAAAALADTFANPTTSQIYSLEGVWNGSTWDRVKSISNGMNTTGTGVQSVAGLAQFDDVSPGTITENQWGPVRMSTNRNQYVTIRDAAGNERGLNIDSSGNISVNTVSSINSYVVAGTGANNLGKAEDALSASSDTGVMGLSVISATPSATAGDLDYAPAKLNAVGAAWTEHITATMTPAYAEYAFGSITGSYTTALTNSNPAKILDLFNGTDVDLLISFNASTNAMILKAGQGKILDLKAANLVFSSNVSVKNNGTAPGVGSLFVTVLY